MTGPTAVAGSGSWQATRPLNAIIYFGAFPRKAGDSTHLQKHLQFNFRHFSSSLPHTSVYISSREAQVATAAAPVDVYDSVGEHFTAVLSP